MSKKITAALEEAQFDREPVLSGVRLRATSYGTKRLVRRAAKFIPPLPEPQDGESDADYQERVRPDRLETGTLFLETWLTVHAVENLDDLDTALEYPSEFRKLITRTMMRFSEADLIKAGAWMNRQLELERMTDFKVIPKPHPEGARDEEIPPPNS
jgi:hypothetical protein